MARLPFRFFISRQSSQSAVQPIGAPAMALELLRF